MFEEEWEFVIICIIYKIMNMIYVEGLFVIKVNLRDFCGEGYYMYVD